LSGIRLKSIPSLMEEPILGLLLSFYDVVSVLSNKQGNSINSFTMKGDKFSLVYGKEVTSSCDEESAR